MTAPPVEPVQEPASETAEPAPVEEPAEPDPITQAMPDPLATALADAPPPRTAHDPSRQEQVVRAARSLLDQRNIVVNGERVRHDCIGMVAAAYTLAGFDITHSISDLYAQAEAAGLAHHNHIPEPGDIVFFDNSYDKNRNGVRDDPFTHVTVVERVDEHGTITMIHLGGKGKPVARRMMNLHHPDQKRNAEGATINSTLRSVHGRDGGPELTAQLFRGFGSIWKLPPE